MNAAREEEAGMHGSIAFKEDIRVYLKAVFFRPVVFAELFLISLGIYGENLFFPYLVFGLGAALIAYFLLYCLFSFLKRRGFPLDDKGQRVNRFELAGLLVLLAIIISTFSLYQNPYLKIFPEKYVQKANAAAWEDGSAYTFNNIQFVLPKDYISSKEQKKDPLFFYSSEKKSAIEVDKETIIPSLERKGKFTLMNFFLILNRLNDDYDLLNALYNSHLGIIPLTHKISALSSSHTVKIYAIKKNSLRGFLFSSYYDSNKLEAKQLRLVEREKKRNIGFTIGQKEKIEDVFLDRLLAGIK